MTRITRFSPHKTALTFACVMAVSSLVLLIPMTLAMMSMPFSDENGTSLSPAMPMGYMLLIPVVYLVLGYVMGIIGIWIYNLVARFTGGIEFETQD